MRKHPGVQHIKKVVIPSQCAHWRGNPPVKRNIFNSDNLDFPKIRGDRHTTKADWFATTCNLSKVSPPDAQTSGGFDICYN